MTLDIKNYFDVKCVVGVVAVAIVADVCLTGGQTIKKIFFGVLGKNNPSYVAPNNSKPKYQVIPHLFHNYENEDEALKMALERVRKNFPEEFQKLLMQKKLSNEDEILSYFKREFSKGLCSGVTDALFDKIHRKESFSLKQSASLLNIEDIFYHHALQELCVKRPDLDIFTMLELLQTRRELCEKNQRQFCEFVETLSSKSSSPPMKEEKSDEEWEQVKKQIRGQLEKDLMHVGKDFHSSTFPQSSNFLILADVLTYQNALEELTCQFPGDVDFVGYMHIPNHLFSFQFGKSGYYLYDSFNTDKGLFEYPDLKTLLQDLRGHVYTDVVCIKGTSVIKTNPNLEFKDLQTNVDELVKKAKGYFGVRPLNKINGLE